jgi:apolipoprotein D and lipocalin family protein
MKQPRARLTSLVALCLGLASCASMGGGQANAPAPAKPLAMSSFFTGRWYEIARTPSSFTDGCVAGTTDFVHRPDGTLLEQDECRKGSPEGKVKLFQGPVHILNPGQNNKFTVGYTLYGFIPFSVTYWVLDEADDGSWFIVANPSFTNADILGRAPRQTPAAVAALTARLQALGFDTSKLEFPPTFPPGSG